MKITHVETISINVPLKPDMTTKTAHGRHSTSPYVLVRIHTDEDLVGLGECTVSPRWSGETRPGCASVIEGLLAPELIGRDPRNVQALRFRMDRVLKRNPFTKAGVEMALWDLAGKAAGVPVYQLLGGKVRDSVRIKMMIGAFDPPKAVELARRHLDWGVTCLKIKVGLDPEEDFQRVKAVRDEAGPDVPITVDANEGWDLATARRMLVRMEPLNLLLAEQLIPGGDPVALADLRRGSAVPMMADESVFTQTDAWNVASRHAADIMSIYPGKHGGILPTIEIAHMAQVAGMACAMGSNLELGIGTAAMLHVGVAARAIASEKYPGDFIGPLYHQGDLITEPLKLGPDVAIPPDGPGLGVELDEEQLKLYRDDSNVAKSID